MIHSNIQHLLLLFLVLRLYDKAGFAILHRLAVPAFKYHNSSKKSLDSIHRLNSLSYKLLDTHCWDPQAY